MRSKLCATTALTPSRRVPFGRPIARTARAVFLPGQTISGVALRVFHGRVEDAHLLAAGLEFRHAALGAGHHQVLDAHVGERAARHDAVVAAARAVAVEINKIDAVLDQVFPAGEVFLMLPAGEM
jgi:hypothetical protein